MGDPIDQLHAAWQQNPDEARTVALCDALVGTRKISLVQEVGGFASRSLNTSAPALTAAGRMYIAVGYLADAQAVLVSAGKVAPREPSVYRWLGEVLLRRGDADRAEKVFERALQLGARDADARMWLDRARVFKPVQERAGTGAVEREVARTLGSSGNQLAVPSVDEITLNRPPLEEQEAPTAERPMLAPRAAGAPASALPKTALSRQEPQPPPSRAVPQASPAPAPAQRTKLSAQAVAPPTSANGPASSEPKMFAAPAQAQPQPQFPASARGFHDDTATVVAPPVVSPSAPQPRSERRLPAIGTLAAPVARPAASSRTLEDGEKPRTPRANEVLDALAVAGIFDREASLLPSTWATPDRAATRKRSFIVLGIASVFLVGGLFGTLHYVRKQRLQAYAEAGQILTTVETDLAAAHTAALPDIEQRMGVAFDKDSRSPRAALDWLRERTVSGLLKGGQEIAFEDALGRAKEVGVGEDKTAFARVASFLFPGDTVAATQQLARMDALGANDAYYQLVAGATLERSGDVRAQERYAAALKLDPTLFLAELYLTRARIMDPNADPAQAAAMAAAFRAKYKDRAEGAALVALAWAQDPSARMGAPPPEVAETTTRAGELPVALAGAPAAVGAVIALAKHDLPKAGTELDAALSKVDGPVMAVWLGELALDLDDEVRARKAALAAVSYAPLYPPARVLAARVELLGDHLDVASQAVDSLDPSTAEVALVRAAVAYERLDEDGLSRAFAALAPAAKGSAELAALQVAPAALEGKLAVPADQLVALGTSPAPFGARIAADVALDRGDLASAQTIIAGMRPDIPLNALRRARLARYSGKMGEAAAASTAAMAGVPGPRTLAERVLVLSATNANDQATQLLARAPQGPLTSWLSAYVAASAGKTEDAKGRVSSLDPPPDLAPVLVRRAAAMALGAVKDQKRGKPLVTALLAAGDTNPDVVAAAKGLGMTVPTPRK